MQQSILAIDMINFINNFNLLEFNSFKINSIAEKYICIDSLQELILLNNTYDLKSKKHLILGGGTNLLLPDYFNGLVINMNIKGINIINETSEFTSISVNAGENWHSFIEFCVENNYYGLENLALIPGKVGAAPVQNIGAYGIEQETRIESVTGLDLTDNIIRTLPKSECKFGYRDSIFKNILKNKFIITSVQYKLDKTFYPILTYKELDEKFAISEFIEAKDVFESIVQIRKNKLPNPEIEGNAGSFFKNPIISKVKFAELTSKFNDLKGFEDNDGIKISAAWLIEKCNWKGKCLDNCEKAAVSSKHSLVLINKGDATSKEIIELADAIIESIKDKFDVILEKEVNIIN